MRGTREVDGVRRAALVIFEPARVERVRLLEERDADRPRTGFERHTRGEASVHRIAGRRRIVARCGYLFVAAERRQMHPLTVYADLELMRILQPARRPEVGAEQPDLELIFAVEWQRDVQLDATHRAQREP